MNFSIRSTVALCGASLLSSAPSVLAQSSTWVGPATGNWNVVANWSNGVPGLGGPSQAIIASGTPVSVTLNASPSLVALTLGSNATLLQPNNADLSLSGLTNDGMWSLSSTGASTDILLLTDALFGGSGSIVLGNSTGNRILAASGTRILTNSVGHAIVGGGQVGVNTLALLNYGTIDSAGLGNLQLDLAPSLLSLNDGLLQARDGGTLTIYGSEIDNSSGVLRAGPNGTLLLRSSTIHGGVIETDPTGVTEGTFEVSTFDGVTFNGNFRQPNNADSAIMGTITNNGTWLLESTGAGTEIRLASDVATIQGGGTLDLSDSASNKIITSVLGRTFVNGGAHTIRGAGQIGAGGIVLVNDGVIEASHPSGLTIDCVATPDSTSAGELRATDGAELLIVGTPLNNEHGLIIAENGGIVRLRSSVITGGVLVGGSGEIRTSVYPPTLVDLEIFGPFRQVEGEDVELQGSIEQYDSWTLQGDATMCEILLTDNVILSGLGEINMLPPTYNNRIHSSGGTYVLANANGHTIRGGGELGVNSTILVNEGEIIGDLLTIDAADGPVSTNAGHMSTSVDGSLILHRSHFENFSGTIAAKEGGTVFLRGTTIVAGELIGEGSGGFIVEDINLPSRFDSLTAAAHVTINDGAELRVRAATKNDGWWSLESTGNNTDIALEPGSNGVVFLSGTGTIELGNRITNRIVAATGTPQLVHGSDHTIMGAGRLGNGGMSIVNYGAIVGSQESSLVISTSSATAGLANHGLVEASGPGELRVESGAFTNDGTVRVKGGSSLTRIGSLMQSAGFTTVDGALSVTGGYTQTGGLLTGDGTVNGNVSIQGGSASPSKSDGSEVGSLAVTGNYGQTLDGGLVVDLSLSGNDVLTATGSVTLGGALQIRLVEPFVPMPGQAFTILTATTISGTFGCIEYPLGGAFFHVVYLPQSVKLVVDATPVLEADLDFDGVVGASDLAILLGAWGDEPCNNAICCPADLNGDGKVNAPDLATLLGDWG